MQTEKNKERHKKATASRPVIYQLFPRLFANMNADLVPDGSLERNGSGKLNAITAAVLAEIAGMGVTHIWYTGVIEHAHDADYTAHGIARHNPHVVKGKAGSPYAITDYYDIDPDLAENVDERMAEFESLLKRTKDAGMKAIIDFVPNHVAREYHSDAAPTGIRDFGTDDNRDMFFSPSNNFYYIPRQQFSPADVDLGEGEARYVEFPARATGNDCFTAFPTKFDWYETVKLNYGYDPGNGTGHYDPIPDTWFKMLHILRFWASKGADGFRCDMAHMVPVEFWNWAIAKVKKDYPDTVFIAELYDVGLYRRYLYDGGFDYLYDKVNLYDKLRGIECADTSAAMLTSAWQTVDGIAHRMLNFIENHDEQRYASTFYSGDAANFLPSMTAVATMSTGAVMIYNGQELGERGMDAEGYSGRDGRTTIFDYWSMDSVRRWLNTVTKAEALGMRDGERALREKYAALLRLVNESESIREGRFFDLMYVNYDSPGFNPHRHFSYLRATEKEFTLVFLNFDSSAARAQVKIPSHAFDFLELPRGRVKAVDALDGKRVNLALEPDGCVDLNVAPHSVAILQFRSPGDKKSGSTSGLKKNTTTQTKTLRKNN